jgi:iron complex outermembrane receptor protein
MRVLILSMFLLFMTTNVDAAVKPQDKSKDLSTTMPEVTVKGDVIKKSLTVPTLAEAKAEINRTPGGVAVTDAEDYKKGRASTLQDALGYTPGVYVQPRFGSDEARLSIRGSGIQRTFHLRGIKLLQDGVIPLNQADGGGDFQSIDPLALKYIEVYRGANALQYGATTLGGAINFVTPSGYDASLAQGRIEAGGFNYLRDQVSSGEVLGPVDYYISLSETRQKGFRNHSDQANKRLFSNLGIRLNDNAETRFYVNLTDSKSKLPGSITKAQMKQNPKQNNVANVTGNQKRDYDQVQIANKTSFKWDDQSFDIGSFYVHKDLFHPIFQVIDQITHDFGTNLRYVNKKDLFSRKNILTLGFNSVWGIADDLRHTNVGGERGVRTAESKQKSSNIDLYAEEQFYVMDQLALVSGMQWSFASRKTRDKFLSDGDHSGHPTYNGISPKLGLRYEFTEQSQVFANFSRSFEPPTFGELSNVTGGGIRDLTEQKASTIEVGTRGEEGRFSWDLAWYYSWVENELLSLNDGFGNPLGTVNAYGTRHQGIELGLGMNLLEGIFVHENSSEVKIAEENHSGFSPKDLLGLRENKEGEDKLVVRGIYNWSRFRFSNDPAFSDNPLPGIPEHFIRAELTYEHPFGIYFGPNMEWTPVDYAVDMNNTLFADSYALLGLKGGYRTKKGVSFFVEAKNLTNEIYAATTGIINNAGGLDSAQFLPGDGRAVYSGVEFRW